ncbi:MAG: hypothetical protein O7H41_12335 [Planctomycetota bacterium]|nr:hypothetical protein [Planctomycetota bacterium]
MDSSSKTSEPRQAEEDGEPLGVLLDDPESADLLQVGAALTGVLGLLQADATHRARYAHGVVLENAEPPVARDLLSALDKHGLAAFTVPADKLLQMPEETRIKEARLDLKVLEMSPGSSFSGLAVPWQQIGAISIYAIEEPIEARVRSDMLLHAVPDRLLRPGLVRAIDEIQERRAKGVEVHLRADFVCPAAGFLLRVDRDCRITGQPDDSPEVHSLERYIRFLEEVIARSGAYVPTSALLFLEEPRIRPIVLARAEERRNRNMWLWHMIPTGRLDERG